MDIPTLVVAGENDSRADGAQTLAGMMPDAKFVSLPGGHDEAPLTPEYLWSILEFLDKSRGRQ